MYQQRGGNCKTTKICCKNGHNLVVRQLEQVHAGGSCGDPLLLCACILDAKWWVQVLIGKNAVKYSLEVQKYNLEA